MKRLFIALVVVLGAEAQFQDLASTADGSRLYFSSAARQKASGQFPYAKIFVADSSGIRLGAQESQGEPTGWSVTNFYALVAPQVASDGSVVAWTGMRHCNGGSGCLSVERYQGKVVRPDGSAAATYPGNIRLSPNGHFVLAFGATALFTGDQHDLYDRQTSVKWTLPLRIEGSGNRRVANDGTVLVSDGARLVLWRSSGTQPLAGPEPRIGTSARGKYPT